MNASRSSNMPQTGIESDEVVNVDDTEDNDLTIVDIQKLLNEEQVNDKDELTDEDDLKDLNQDDIEDDLQEIQPKKKKQTTSKRPRSQKFQKRIKKKPRKRSTPSKQYSKKKLTKITEIELSDTDTDTDADPTKTRTVYTCKFCHKDFFSAFVLCLHVQIHEKVNSVTTSNHKNSSLPDTSLHANDIAKDIKKISGKSMKTEKLVADSVSGTGKTESVGVINKNFVANLKKNLSLAMKRKL